MHLILVELHWGFHYVCQALISEYQNVMKRSTAGDEIRIYEYNPKVVGQSREYLENLQIKKRAKDA